MSAKPSGEDPPHRRVRKLLGQVELVRQGLPRVARGGSFTNDLSAPLTNERTLEQARCSAYVRSIEGGQTGQIYRVEERF